MYRIRTEQSMSLMRTVDHWSKGSGNPAGTWVPAIQTYALNDGQAQSCLSTATDENLCEKSYLDWLLAVPPLLVVLLQQAAAKASPPCVRHAHLASLQYKLGMT